ncbi:hypothetical protein H4219_005530 [Mycoemilia scoparia]|uniref:Uncharacterized protein n=1 Tax=Mycoemilia scoparia TaxID=417184 RepID=A0A9W8DPW6_9FUNG|nr:hypothetical protein H4219_005530 [Mycoemilia scoparia]
MSQARNSSPSSEGVNLITSGSMPGLLQTQKTSTRRPSLNRSLKQNQLLAFIGVAESVPHLVTPFTDEFGGSDE